MNPNTLPAVLQFGTTTFDVIDRNGDPWLKQSEIASALYGKGGDQSGPASANSIRQVQKLYQRHADEFTGNMTALVETATASGKQNIRIFSLRGAHLLAMFARTQVAKEFRVWVLDVVDREMERLRAAFSVGRRDVLTASQAEQLRLAMKKACEKLPKDRQGDFMKKGWCKMKSHFGVSYRQIPQAELTEALSIIGRHAAEWDVVDSLPAPTAPAMDDTLKNNLEGLCTHVEFLRSWWQTYEPAIRTLAPEVAGRVHDHFVEGVCFARNVASSVGIAMNEKIKTYPWREDSYVLRMYFARDIPT